MYIDLSKYNRVVDWKAVSDNVDGIILRVGYRGYSSGKIVLDPMFKNYARECFNYAIPFGIYFMSQAITPMEAIEEADFALNYAEDFNASLPIFIDSEDGDGTAKIVRADALNKIDRTNVCEFFCNTINNSRRKAGIYASTSWFENRLDVSRLNNYLLWVAQYGPKCTAKHRVDMWQYTSSGQVPGINGKVDCSILYGFPNEHYKPSVRTLRQGDRGPDVLALQNMLNLRYNAGLRMDGIFGARTKQAVMNMQRINNIAVDGIVGEQTRKYLFGEV